MKKIPFIVFILLAFSFAALLISGKDTAIVPSALIGKQMPTFILPGLSSKDVRGAPAIVNVFASWCVACIAEAGTLKTLSQSAKVYGIAYKDKPAPLKAWLKKYGNPYAKIGDDAAGRVSIDWGVYGVPETFVVGADGIVRYKHTGPVAPADVPRLLEMLK